MTWLSQQSRGGWTQTRPGQPGRNQMPLALAAFQNPFATREQLALHVQAPGLPPPWRGPCGRCWTAREAAPGSLQAALSFGRDGTSEHRRVLCRLAGGLPRTRPRQTSLRSPLRTKGQAPRVWGTASWGQPWWAVTWRLGSLPRALLGRPGWETERLAAGLVREPEASPRTRLRVPVGEVPVGFGLPSP